jgi:hypothetical protein
VAARSTWILRYSNSDTKPLPIDQTAYTRTACEAQNNPVGAKRNLLAELPQGVDLYEFRKLLELRIGGPGQYNCDSRRRLYIPLGGDACRLVLVFSKKSLAMLQTIERGPAFAEEQWQAILDEVGRSLVSGPLRVGRDYCFASRRVIGSWRGVKSGVQILPPPEGVPIAPVVMAQHPFILEFPLRETNESALTNVRRLRRVRTLTALLNVLLNAAVRPHWTTQPDHLWVAVPAVDTRRFKFERLRRWFRLPPNAPMPSRIEWAQEFFFAPLDPLVSDYLSPAATDRIQVVESSIYRDWRRRPVSDGLQVPSDLDESLYAYTRLQMERRRRLDRSLYWLQLASRFGYRHMAASFVGMVSAIEALTEAGGGHRAQCTECKDDFYHRVPGPTAAFRRFLDLYAPGPQLNSRRQKMYELRSGLVHGSVLMDLDDERHSVWDPAQNHQTELWAELFDVTRIAIKNWLNDPANY